MAWPVGGLHFLVTGSSAVCSSLGGYLGGFTMDVGWFDMWKGKVDFHCGEGGSCKRRNGKWTVVVQSWSFLDAVLGLHSSSSWPLGISL